MSTIELSSHQTFGQETFLTFLPLADMINVPLREVFPGI